MSKERVQVKTRSGRVASRISLTDTQPNKPLKTQAVKKPPKKTSDKSNNDYESDIPMGSTVRRTRSKQKGKNDLPATPISETSISTKASKSKQVQNTIKKVTTTERKELPQASIKNKRNSAKKDTSTVEIVDFTANNRAITNLENTFDTTRSKCSSRSSTRNNESKKALHTDDSPLKSNENHRKSLRLSNINFEAAGSSTPIVNKKISNTSTTESPAKQNTTQRAIININKTTAKVPIYKRTTVKSPIKQVQSKSNIKSLRPRRTNKKYKEFENSETITLDGDDTPEEKDDENVPIYKKPVKGKGGPRKPTKDVYEFEADSCEQSQSDSDNEYDKEMIEEMQLIKKIERKQTVAAIKKKIAKKARNKAVLPDVVAIKQYKKQNNQNKDNKIEINAVKKHVIKEVKKITVIQDIQVNIMNNLEVHKVHSDQNNVEVVQSVQHQDGADLISELVDSFIDNAPECMNNSFGTQPNSTANQFKIPAGTLVKVPARAFRRPVANSTMTMSSHSPSRASLVFRNGPYMLQTKGDNLPSFNQDIVLNSTIAEAHEPFFNSRISAILPTSPKVHEVQAKRTKQTSILKYMPGRQSEVEELHCTLFDENLLLSPVKNSTPVRTVNSPDKKRALRDISNVHASIINTPERESSDVEFFALSATVDRVRPGKPTRFPIKSPKSPKKADKEQEKSSPAGEKALGDTSVFDSPASQLKDEDDGSKDVVGIFEDYDALQVTRQDLPSFTYARRRKRIRRISYESDNDAEDDSIEDEQKRKRRKKRGEMTKKEKEQLDVWATSFNEMCDEIDQFDLEVE